MHSEVELVAAPATARSWATTLRAYVVLTKPSIILLLLITTAPAMVLASGGWPSTWLVAATLIGGMMAAGGAGAVNMYIDRDIDAIMSRTRSRPIPSGTVPARHALIFGLLLGAGSAIWLTLTVNPLAAALAFAAFLFYTAVYSAYLKRHTVHNTVLGGAAGAAPPLIGWAAVTGEIGLPGVLLFLIVFYWQPPHFWALALALEDDYRRAGLPMMPIVFGERRTKQQIVFYSILTAALSLIFGAVAGLGLLYLIVALIGGAGFVWFSLRVYMTHGSGAMKAMFRYSTAYLAILFLVIALDHSFLV